MTRRHVATGLLTEEDPPRLIGGRHRESGRMVFPMPPQPDAYEAVPLPRSGTLWSYTIQRFEPKTPPYQGSKPFEPYAVGYVELPQAVIVESRLTAVDFDALRIGMPMELTTIPLRTEADGDIVMTFAFRPEGGAA